MKAGKQNILILEPGNLENLKNGEPIRSPDKEVLVAYCPDIDWLSAEILKLVDEKHQIDAKAFDEIMERGMLRPTVYREGSEKVKQIF